MTSNAELQQLSGTAGQFLTPSLFTAILPPHSCASRPSADFPACDMPLSLVGQCTDRGFL